MAQKIALGKGLASLIHQTNTEDIVAQTVLEDASPEANSAMLIDVSQIKVNPNQPRKIFKEKELQELAESIRENGIIQPLIVKKGEVGFELIAGERRLRAAQKIGLEKVPAIVKQVTDREKMIMAVIENIQREDLNCVEEALAYFQLMDDFKITQEELAKKLGKERSSIANFLRILKLPRAVIEFLQADALTFGHAKLLVGLKEEDVIVRLAKMAVEKELSVRDLAELIKVEEEGRPPRPIKDPMMQERFNELKEKLERRTGFHCAIKGKANGSGQIIIKYTSEAEFNDIYDYLLKTRGE